MTDDTEKPNTEPTASPFAEHSRHWESFSYVYPVVSRRSKGLSIGINLNPDTICNFDCVYCQVDKLLPANPIAVDTQTLDQELSTLIEAVASGKIWSHPRFAHVDPKLRRLNDIAFSGDGEPTSARCFNDAVDMVARIKKEHHLDDTKIVLITNATLLNRPNVEQAIQILDANQGEVWAKLDAGTQAYYELVDRSAVPLSRVLDNIQTCGRNRPIVIQTMLMQLHGKPIPDSEFDAYTARIKDLIEHGCKIKLIQLYTVARKPLEPYVAALNNEALTAFADQLRQTISAIHQDIAVPVEVYGSGS